MDRDAFLDEVNALAGALDHAGFIVSDRGEGRLEVEAPAWRTDHDPERVLDGILARGPKDLEVESELGPTGTWIVTVTDPDDPPTEGTIDLVSALVSSLATHRRAQGVAVVSAAMRSPAIEPGWTAIESAWEAGEWRVYAERPEGRSCYRVVGAGSEMGFELLDVGAAG